MFTGRCKLNSHSCSRLLTLWSIKPTTIPREGTNGATTVSVYVLGRHIFRATYTQFVLRPTPKAAHNKMSNTRTIPFVHTVVSLPEGFRSCLSSIYCADCEGGPSTDGVVVTSACNRVPTARKICGKKAFLSLVVSPYSFVSSWFIPQYDTAHWDCNCNILQFHSMIKPTEIATAIFYNSTVWYSPLRLQLQYFTISISTFCFHAQFCTWPTPL